MKLTKKGFTSKELALMLGISTRELNRRLEEKGFQKRVNGKWVPTKKGTKHLVK